jgi:hypothetical protein
VLQTLKNSYSIILGICQPGIPHYPPLNLIGEEQQSNRTLATQVDGSRWIQKSDVAVSSLSRRKHTKAANKLSVALPRSHRIESYDPR